MDFKKKSNEEIIQGKLRLENAEDTTLKRSKSIDYSGQQKLSMDQEQKLGEIVQNQQLGEIDKFQKVESASSKQNSKKSGYVDKSMEIEQRMRHITSKIDVYIDAIYSQVYAREIKKSGYKKPEGIIQNIKSLTDKTAKNRSFEKNTASREFGSIEELQQKLEIENNPIIQLKLKEEIIANRNKGLSAISKLSSMDAKISEEKKQELSLSEQMELGALYLSELEKLEKEKGEATELSPSKKEYAGILKEKLKKTKERVKNKEKRLKEYDLANMLLSAYKGGKKEYYEKYNSIKASISDKTIDKVAIDKACQKDVENFDKMCIENVKTFGEKKLVMKAINDEKTGKVEFVDSIGEKYKTLLSMDFVSIQHFDATYPRFVQMGKDILSICADKKADYKKNEARIEELKKEREALINNTELSDEAKEEQRKKLDEAIVAEKKGIDVIEQEMTQLLKYEYFRKRIIKLYKLFGTKSVTNITNIMVDMEYIFNQGKINYKNYDYTQVGKIRWAKKMDTLLGIERAEGEKYYMSLLDVDRFSLNEEDKRDAKLIDDLSVNGIEMTKDKKREYKKEEEKKKEEKKKEEKKKEEKKKEDAKIEDKNA